MARPKAKPPSNDILSVLKRARKLIDKPEKFCKGWLAEDANGNAVHISASHAKKFDLLGACVRTDPDFIFPPELQTVFFEGNAAVFADTYGHELTLKALDETIAYLEL